MARPIKPGLDYFPFDTDFSDNKKVEALMGEFGSKGVLMMVYLLSAIYKEGYFLQWDKLTEMQLVNKIDGMSSKLADQIVTRLIDYGTFDKELFNSAKVLTSLRIQETYLDATKRRKSKKLTLYRINVSNNSTSSDVNEDINPQSKGKESKVNKTKEKNTKKNESSSVIQSISNLYQENIGAINPITFQMMEDAVKDFKTQGTSEDESGQIVQEAIKIAAQKNAHSWKFIQGILNNWQNDSLFTLDNIKAHESNRNTKKQNDGNSSHGRDPLYDLPF